MDRAPRIRLAASADATVIATLSRSEIETGLSWSWTPARVLRAIADPATNVVVACQGEDVAGFGIMKYRDESAHLCLFAVRPAARGQGVGSALLRWLEQVALVGGAARFHLEARRANILALDFYRTHGYALSATIAGMYEGVEDGVRLEKIVR